MIWIIYFVISVIVTAILTKFKNIRRLWIMGLLTILFIYGIDGTLVALGAYSYRDPCSVLSRLPIFYLLSGFPGGILLAYFYPYMKRYQFMYILTASAIFLLLETVIRWLGYIEYNNWNLVRSYFLDIGSFMAMLWLGQWLDATGKSGL